MEKLLLSIVLCFALFQGTFAYRCLRYRNTWYETYSTYINCNYGCCRTAYYRYCCSYTDYSYSCTWSLGAIAGAVIGGIIGFCVLIAIIIAIIKACNRTGTNERLVQPVQANNGVFAVKSSTQAYPSTTQYGTSPLLYPTPVMSYPPQAGQQPLEPGQVG